jgi:hypothetical protein
MRVKTLLALATFCAAMPVQAQQTGVWIASDGYITTPAGNTYMYNADGTITCRFDDGFIFTPAPTPRNVPGE